MLEEAALPTVIPHLVRDPGNTLDYGATINGLRATLTANLDLRGYCGRIQTAANSLESTNEIRIKNGDFEEDVNIYNKYSLTLSGQSNDKFSRKSITRFRI